MICGVRAKKTFPSGSRAKEIYPSFTSFFFPSGSVISCEESAQTESFSSGLLEHPQYTRPREFEGLTVPEPLLNGNHAHIVDWQLSESLYLTLKRRPEMAKAYLEGRKFTWHEKKVVDAVFERIRNEEQL